VGGALLGCHVRDRAEAGRADRQRRVDRGREPEVEQHHAPLRRHAYVAGLEIAVDEAGGVQGREPVRQLGEGFA
jgi:hypothetical protein